MSDTYTVYGGTGHKQLASLPTMEEAREWATKFERQCAQGGAQIPRSIIKKEEGQE